MQTYKNFARTLNQLLGQDQCVRLRAEGFMPLVLEEIGRSGDGRRLVAISHTAVQNGDLMRDPELVFAFHSWPDGEVFAEPVSFRNDFLGVLQEVYDWDDRGQRTHVRPGLKRELKSFARTWFRNLKAQGFLDAGVKREVLS